MLCSNTNTVIYGNTKAQDRKVTPRHRKKKNPQRGNPFLSPRRLLPSPACLFLLPCFWSLIGVLHCKGGEKPTPSDCSSDRFRVISGSDAKARSQEVRAEACVQAEGGDGCAFSSSSAHDSRGREKYAAVLGVKRRKLRGHRAGHPVLHVRVSS